MPCDRAASIWSAVRCAICLLNENATVTIAHFALAGSAELLRARRSGLCGCRQARNVRAATGSAGATVIDVHQPHCLPPTAKTKLVGDVAYAEAAYRRRAITPVRAASGK